MSNGTIGDKLRKLREENQMPLRKVAALLDIDVSILSKMERGERPLSKEIVMKLATIYKYDAVELTVLFLSQKIVNEVGEEELALRAMQLAEEQMVYKTTAKVDLNTIIQKIKTTLKNYKSVKKAWIFGSFVRGQEDYKSDIDLLIETYENVKFSYFDLFEIQHQLEISTDRKIDLGFYDSVKPEPWERIKKEIQLIYER